MAKEKQNNPMTLFALGFLIIIALGAFYVFYFKPNQEERITQARASCVSEATDSAQSLLRTKSELDPQYKEAVGKDLYLRDDYNTAYKRCLQRAGLTE